MLFQRHWRALVLASRSQMVDPPAKQFGSTTHLGLIPRNPERAKKKTEEVVLPAPGSVVFVWTEVTT